MENPASSGLSPRTFLRRRSPHLFSDSVAENSAVLNRSMLEYQLDTLTSRGQENDFEEFARQLLMREVCPNLLPHTGPTGGGDSKVDSETYPVAEALACAWFVGDGSSAGERWAFAFSAKKDWRPKLESDVTKIVATGRGYRKAFFVTNQFVSDKNRAKAETELSQAHGLDVRIFDRTWILDRVFTNHREELAIITLNLQLPIQSSVKIGPQDLEAGRELKELEERIARATEAKEFGLLFAADCLEAAKVARNLERPRLEVDGRFARAKRAAEKLDSHQKFIAAYHEAWTNYWWFEDFKRFNELYPEAEKHVLGTQNPYELELLSNLWVTLFSLVRRDALTSDEAKITERTALLVRELDRLCEVEGRPSARLHARCLRVEADLLQHVLESNESDAEADLRRLKGIVLEAEGLIGFPFEPMVKIVTELGDMCGELPAYGELFDAIVDASSRRDGEVTAARLLIKRGAAQLKADNTNEAVRTLGRALAKLYKEETRKEMVQTLGLCAAAYEDLGLLWAARGSMVNAASLATAEFWTYSDVTSLQAHSYKRIKWLELQLGRLPHALAWHEVDRVVRAVLVKKGMDEKELMADEFGFGVVLGILLLRSDMEQLKRLVQLPDKLISLDLESSAAALWFAIGWVDFLPKELQDSGKQLEYFRKWIDQAVAVALPVRPHLYDSLTVEMNSRVLGCRITVACDNQSPCLEVAESLLAAVESLLATTDTQGLVALEPRMTVEVTKVAGGPKPFTVEFSDPDGIPHLRIACGDFNPHSLPTAEHQKIKEEMMQILAGVVARVFLAGDPDKSLNKLLGDDRAMDRALHFTSSFVTVGNVMGYQPKHALAAWIESAAETYPVRRTQLWNHADAETDKNRPPAKPVGEDQENDSSRGSVRHTEMETVSVVRKALWDQAKWRGMAFFLGADASQPPILALAFLERDAPTKIFEGWAKELGKRDTAEKIRITIVRGFNRSHPLWYRVMINSNVGEDREATRPRYLLMTGRKIVMEATTTVNLDNFIKHYQRCGGYFLCRAWLKDLTSRPELINQPALVKRLISVRDAWEIGPDDPDFMALEPTDDPVIPLGKPNPPVMAALQRLRELKQAGE